MRVCVCGNWFGTKNGTQTLVGGFLQEIRAESRLICYCTSWQRTPILAAAANRDCPFCYVFWGRSHTLLKIGKNSVKSIQIGTGVKTLISRKFLSKEYLLLSKNPFSWDVHTVVVDLHTRHMWLLISRKILKLL